MVNPAPPVGRFDRGAHRFPLRVYFEDTDLSGVVYHANYLRFMERARSDMLECAGLDQRADFEGGAGVWAVARLQIRYVRPARLGDALEVATRVVALTGATARMEQQVRRGEDVLTEAQVTAAWLTTDGRPQRQPAAWRETIARHFEELR